MAEAVVIDDILRRHGIAPPASLLVNQGVGATVWRAGDLIIKIARPGRGDELRREAIVGPAARAVGVRTPALIFDGGGRYNIWQRADGELFEDGRDARVWRDVGRQLAKLHAIDRCADPQQVILTWNKRDARPYLQALGTARAASFAGWLDRLERVPAGPRRLLHYDVHKLNIVRSAEGATLIDWGDAAWGDPASDFGSLPMGVVPAVLDGYEEIASLGQNGEARIVRAVIGQAVRKLAQNGRTEPLDALLAFVAGDVPPRWREYLLYDGQ